MNEITGNRMRGRGRKGKRGGHPKDGKVPHIFMNPPSERQGKSANIQDLLTRLGLRSQQALPNGCQNRSSWRRQSTLLPRRQIGRGIPSVCECIKSLHTSTEAHYVRSVRGGGAHNTGYWIPDILVVPRLAILGSSRSRGYVRIGTRIQFLRMFRLHKNDSSGYPPRSDHRSRQLAGKPITRLIPTGIIGSTGRGRLLLPNGRETG